MIFVIIGLITCVVFAVFMLVRNQFTFYVMNLVAEAIYRYQISLIDSGERFEPEMYDRIMPYDTYMYRFWDWSYYSVLPAEDLMKVRPYILDILNERNRK